MSPLEQNSGDSRRIWEALAFILHRVYEPLEEAEAEWAIIGSAASALQDIAVSPNELRILSAPDAFDIWSTHLWDWLDEEPDNRDPSHARLTLTVEHAPATIIRARATRKRTRYTARGRGRNAVGCCRQSTVSELARAGRAARSAIRNHGRTDDSQSDPTCMAAIGRQDGKSAVCQRLLPRAHRGSAEPLWSTGRQRCT